MMNQKDQTAKKVGFLFYASADEDAARVSLALPKELESVIEPCAILIQDDKRGLEALEQKFLALGVPVYKLNLGNKLRVPELTRIKKLIVDQGIQVVQTYRADADFIGFTMSRWIEGLDWIHTIQDPSAYKKLSFKKRLAYRRLLRSNHWTVFWAQQHKKKMGRKIKQSKSFVVYPGVQDLSAIQKSYRGDGVCFVCCGNFEPGCGFEEIIKAFMLVRANRPYIQLKIFGQGSLESKIEAIVESLDVGEDIQLLPRPHQMAAMMTDHTVFVQTNKDVSASLDLVTAMSLAQPIIAFNTGEVSEYVNDGEEALIVPNGNAYQLSVAMQKMIENTDARKRLGENAFKVYQQKFTQDQMIQSYKMLYRMV